MRRLPVEQAARGEGAPSSLRSDRSTSRGSASRSPSKSSRSQKKKKKVTGSPLTELVEDEEDEQQAMEASSTYDNLEADPDGLAAASSCLALVPTAAQPDAAAKLQKLLHGDLAELAIATLHGAPRAMASLLEIATAASTPAEARVRLLACLAACHESKVYKELDQAAEQQRLHTYLSVLAEPDASMELQASLRRLLCTAQMDALRVT